MDPSPSRCTPAETTPNPKRRPTCRRWENRQCPSGTATAHRPDLPAPSAPTERTGLNDVGTPRAMLTLQIHVQPSWLHLTVEPAHSQPASPLTSIPRPLQASPAPGEPLLPSPLPAGALPTQTPPYAHRQPTSDQTPRTVGGKVGHFGHQPSRRPPSPRRGLTHRVGRKLVIYIFTYGFNANN